MSSPLYRVVHNKYGYKLQQRKFFIWHDVKFEKTCSYGSDFGGDITDIGIYHAVYFDTETELKTVIDGIIRDQKKDIVERILYQTRNLSAIKKAMR